MLPHKTLLQRSLRMRKQFLHSLPPMHHHHRSASAFSFCLRHFVLSPSLPLAVCPSQNCCNRFQNKLKLCPANPQPSCRIRSAVARGGQPSFRRDTRFRIISQSPFASDFRDRFLPAHPGATYRASWMWNAKERERESTTHTDTASSERTAKTK